MSLIGGMTRRLNVFGIGGRAASRPAPDPLLLNAKPCHPEWEEIFNFHYAGMTSVVINLRRRIYTAWPTTDIVLFACSRIWFQKIKT
jgi:hypothetical protein